MINKAEEYGKIIKDIFLQKLKKEVAPWQEPFHDRLAYNFTTNIGNKIRPYAFVNQLLLNCVDDTPLRIYATENQIIGLNSEYDLDKLKNRELKLQNLPIRIKDNAKPKYVLSQYGQYYVPAANIGTEEYKNQKALLDEAMTYKETDYKKFIELLTQLQQNEQIVARSGGRIYYKIYSLNDIQGLNEQFIRNETERFKNFNNLNINNDLTISQREENGDFFISNFFANHPDIKLERMNIGTPHYSYKIDYKNQNELERKIVLPNKDQMENLSSYYSTAFHEIAHSEISHKEREENRKKGFFKTDYAYEEFQVELTAYMLSNYLGLSSIFSEKQNIAYCQHWMKTLDKIDNSRLYNCINNACRSYENLINEYEKNLEFEKQVNNEKTTVFNFQR